MKAKTRIKVCGVTTVDDAAYAASSGMDYIGLVFASRSKRRVGLAQAKEMAAAARAHGAEPVGVFTEQCAAEIVEICGVAGLRSVQLHGAVARTAFYDLPEDLHVFYAIEINERNQVVPPNYLTLSCVLQLNPVLASRCTLLFDSAGGGSGIPFFHGAVTFPRSVPFFIAGGLTEHNVGRCIAEAQPGGVDVSGGVKCEGSQRIDRGKLARFIESVRKDTSRAGSILC